MRVSLEENPNWKIWQAGKIERRVGGAHKCFPWLMKSAATVVSRGILIFLSIFPPYFNFRVLTDTFSVPGWQRIDSDDIILHILQTPLGLTPWNSFDAIPDTCRDVQYPLFDHPDFRHYHSCVNTLSAAVMTPRVIFFPFPPIFLVSSTPRCWGRTASSEASFPHACTMLCKMIKASCLKIVTIVSFYAVESAGGGQ